MRGDLISPSRISACDQPSDIAHKILIDSQMVCISHLTPRVLYRDGWKIMFLGFVMCRDVCVLGSLFIAYLPSLLLIPARRLSGSVRSFSPISVSYERMSGMMELKP